MIARFLKILALACMLGISGATIAIGIAVCGLLALDFAIPRSDTTNTAQVIKDPK